MKIWICGVDGMMGSHMKRLLTHLEIPHVGTNRKELDILQFDSVSDFVRVQKISHIVNCAAYTNVDKAETEQREAYLANAMGPHHLGIAARRHGARVIHFSTDYVFGKSLYSYSPVRKHLPYVEEDNCAPLGAYGMSKLAGEIKLLDEHQHVCIIRTSWLFGFPGKNFVNTMVQFLSTKEDIQVVNDQIGRPTYCGDLAEITIKLLDAEGIFHYANAFETNWHAFAQEIYRQLLQLEVPVVAKAITPISSKDFPQIAVRPSYSTLSTRKIENFLGVSPRPWQEALRDYLLLTVKNKDLIFQKQPCAVG